MIKKGITILLFLISVHVQSQMIPELRFHPDKGRFRNIKDSKLGKLGKPYETNDSLIRYFKLDSAVYDKEWDILSFSGLGICIGIKMYKDSLVYTNGDKVILIMNSHIPPFASFRYNVKGLDNDSIHKVSQYLRNLSYQDSVLFDARQTCISYAFENIFKYNGIEPAPIFSYRTMVNDKDLMHIIDKFLIKETCFDVKDKKLEKYKFPEKTFILFYNKEGKHIHACYFMDGRIWSKNGNFPYTSYLHIQSILKYIYKETAKIEIYTFNQKAFKKT